MGSPFLFLLEGERNITFTLLGTSKSAKRNKIYVQENVFLFLALSTHSKLKTSTVLGIAKNSQCESLLIVVKVSPYSSKRYQIFHHLISNSSVVHL